MPIRNGFPHQFTPAVPKGTVADIKHIIDLTGSVETKNETLPIRTTLKS
jgi:hypothetical protein